MKYFACVMVNLMFFYPAEIMNHFVCVVLFDFTRWMIAGDFYA